MRTTSPLESFNSVIGRSCPKHPHIFQLMDYMKLHEYEVKMEKLVDLSESSKPNGPIRKRDQERDQKIKFATKMLQEGNATVDDFLSLMANEEALPDEGFCYILFINQLTFILNRF